MNISISIPSIQVFWTWFFTKAPQTADSRLNSSELIVYVLKYSAGLKDVICQASAGVRLRTPPSADTDQDYLSPHASDHAVAHMTFEIKYTPIDDQEGASLVVTLHHCDVLFFLKKASRFQLNQHLDRHRFNQHVCSQPLLHRHSHRGWDEHDDHRQSSQGQVGFACL